jgi:hypothetical protein
MTQVMAAPSVRPASALTVLDGVTPVVHSTSSVVAVGSAASNGNPPSCDLVPVSVAADDERQGRNRAANVDSGAPCTHGHLELPQSKRARRKLMANDGAHAVHREGENNERRSTSMTGRPRRERQG